MAFVNGKWQEDTELCASHDLITDAKEAVEEHEKEIEQQEDAVKKLVGNDKSGTV